MPQGPWTFENLFFCNFLQIYMKFQVVGEINQENSRRLKGLLKSILVYSPVF